MEGLPQGVRDLFLLPEPKAKDVIEIALGPEGSYAVVYQSSAGLRLLYHGLPDALRQWLIPVAGKGVSATRDLNSLQVSLGPNNSFFAFDKKGALWSNLPKDFDYALSLRRNSKGNFNTGKYPSSVSFGPDGSFVMIMADGCCIHNLRGYDDVLEPFLESRKLGKLKDVVCYIAFLKYRR